MKKIENWLNKKGYEYKKITTGEGITNIWLDLYNLKDYKMYSEVEKYVNRYTNYKISHLDLTYQVKIYK